MTVALDTDILVGWMMDGSPHHAAIRRLLDREVQRKGDAIGLTPQVLYEFLHVATDPKRFANPIPMPAAVDTIADLWSAGEVTRILPGPTVVARTAALLKTLRLGRKRILDTALAATLEAAGVRRLATLNRQDFAVFPFLELVAP